jgi:antitoxin CptB
MSSELLHRRKRLTFRAWHRGTRETDLMIGGFADAHLSTFDAAQLDRFEALIEVPDLVLFDWVTGRAAAAPDHDHDVLHLMQRFARASLIGKAE